MLFYTNKVIFGCDIIQQHSDLGGVGDGAGAEGAVQFGGTGFVQDLGGVMGIDACTAEYCDSAASCTDKFPEQGYALLGGGLLAGCEDAVASQTCNLVECLEGVAAYIEGTMEGDADLSACLTCMLHHLPGLLEVYVTIGGECSDDYAVGTELQCGVDVCKNLLDFLCGIDEISCTGPYEYVYGDVCGVAEGYCLAYHRCIGGESVVFEVATEFDAMCSALYGCADAGDIAAAYFQYHVIGRIVSRLHLNFSRCHRVEGRYGRFCRSCGR